QTIWTQCLPIIVRGTSDRFQMPWTPESFIQHFGSDKCKLVNCQDKSKHLSTLRDFFHLFSDAPDAVMPSLMLKDWPPTEHFRTVYSTLYDDFQKALPVPDYTESDGVFNIASHFLSNGVAPDLGPTLYVALPDKSLHRTTRLHLDATDAINILLHASPGPDGELGGTLWHIFSPEDSSSIRKFLTNGGYHCDHGDPIHSHNI
ncbi:hypothetical protein JAAARDRAFT_85644, partial [Jaapia argillacea MUCL 33604]